MYRKYFDLGDSLTVAELLENEFVQDRQIQSEKVAYKARTSRVSIQMKSADLFCNNSVGMVCDMYLNM